MSLPERTGAAPPHALGIDEAMSGMPRLRKEDGRARARHAIGRGAACHAAACHASAATRGSCRALARRASATAPRLERRGPRGSRPSSARRLRSPRVSWSVDVIETTRPGRSTAPSAPRFRGRLRARRRRESLWETWWFEARNADALAVLAKMPDADVDARTAPSTADPTRRTAVDGRNERTHRAAAQRDDSRSSCRRCVTWARLEPDARR